MSHVCQDVLSTLGIPQKGRKMGNLLNFRAYIPSGCEAGLELFFDYGKQNDVYLIASVRGPRVKTRWIKKNLNDSDKIII